MKALKKALAAPANGENGDAGETKSKPKAKGGKKRAAAEDGEDEGEEKPAKKGKGGKKGGKKGKAAEEDEGEGLFIHPHRTHRDVLTYML